jgi:hypothetical protein
VQEKRRWFCVNYTCFAMVISFLYFVYLMEGGLANQQCSENIVLPDGNKIWVEIDKTNLSSKLQHKMNPI